MASQGSQPALLTPLSLPLLKFSHATAAEGSTAPIPWKHINSRNELFVVLDTFDVPSQVGATEKRQRFQVLHDNEVLEYIDLNILATQAQNAALNAQEQDSVNLRPYPTIVIVVKMPCIAMRYPLPAGRVRRFQVRFAEDEHFYETMKRLAKAGVPITEASAPAPAAPAPQGLANDGIAQPAWDINDRRSAMNMAQTNSNIEGPNYPLSVAEVGPKTGHTMASTTSACAQMNLNKRDFSSGNVATLENTDAYGESRWSNKEHITFKSGTSQVGMEQVMYTRPQNSEVRCSDSTLYTPGVSSYSKDTSEPDVEDMPPKRDLPFLTKQRRRTSLKQSSTHLETQGNNYGEPNKAQAASSSESSASLTEKSGSTSTTRKRQPSTATKEPMAKKPRIVTSRKKTEPKRANKDTTVQTVEQLLQNGRPAVNPTPPTPLTKQSLETQTLVEPAQAGLRRSCRRKTISSIILQREEHNAPRKPTGASFSKTLIRKPRSTATKQVTQADQTASNSIPSIVPLELKSQDPTSDRTTFQNLSAPNDQKYTQNDSEPEQIMEKANTTTSALSVLLADPNFACARPSMVLAAPSLETKGVPTTSASKLREFTNLPQDTKHQAIETWVCQNLDDDDFLHVCRVVEGVWARAFVKL